MSQKTTFVQPTYLVNYRPGQVGFSYSGGVIGSGIAYFDRNGSAIPDVPKDIKISHVFLVTGEDQIMEMTTPRSKISKLSDYTDSSTVNVFLREPVDLDDATATMMRNLAHCRLGIPYGYPEIFGQFLANCLVGRGLNWLTRGFWHKATTGIFGWWPVCSSWVAAIMNDIPKYHGKGVLSGSISHISPNELANSPEIWKPFSTVIKGKIVS